MMSSTEREINASLTNADWAKPGVKLRVVKATAAMSGFILHLHVTMLHSMSGRAVRKLVHSR